MTNSMDGWDPRRNGIVRRTPRLAPKASGQRSSAGRATGGRPRLTRRPAGAHLVEAYLSNMHTWISSAHLRQSQNPLLRIYPGSLRRQSVETLRRVGEVPLRVPRAPIGTVEGRTGTLLIILGPRLCLQRLGELPAGMQSPGVGTSLTSLWPWTVSEPNPTAGLVP
jgi:hypothetical protein